MWVFLLVLAIVPLFFYLADSIQEVFPVLAPWLPQKTEKMLNAQESQQNNNAQPAFRENSKEWVQSDSKGYVAWLRSEDGVYRLGVGCRPGEPLALSLTPVATGTAATPVPTHAMLNYQFGTMPLNGGVYAERDLLGAVSQFSEMTVTVAGDGAPSRVIAKFSPSLADSGRVARNLQQNCY